MPLAIIQTPATLPVLLEDAKDLCSVDGSAHDVLLNRLIEAVTSWLAGRDGWLGRSLCDQTLEWTSGGEVIFGPIILPRPPFLSIEAAHYLDGDTETALTLSDLRTWTGSDGLTRVEPVGGWSWWDGDRRRLRIRYKAGYGTAEDPARGVDPGLQHAILAMVARLFENREAGLSDPAARELFSPFIVWGPR